MISVIVPTIAGREKWLEKCHDSYCATTEDFEFIVMRDYPTCNQGWNAGIEEAKGDFIHLTADDIEATPGWWQAGMEWIAKGHLPGPRIINSDGTVQSCGDTVDETPTGTWTELTRVPFFSREQMDTFGIYPIIPTMYFGDSWVSHKARLHGCETVVVREMCFVHSFANVGRKDEQLWDDLKVFKRAKQRDGIRS